MVVDAGGAVTVRSTVVPCRVIVLTRGGAPSLLPESSAASTKPPAIPIARSASARNGQSRLDRTRRTGTGGRRGAAMTAVVATVGSNDARSAATNLAQLG